MLSHVWNQRGSDAVLYKAILDTVQLASSEECFVTCLNVSGCFGFDYSESAGECILHDGAAITLTTPQLVTRGEETWQNFGKLKNRKRNLGHHDASLWR